MPRQAFAAPYATHRDFTSDTRYRLNWRGGQHQHGRPPRERGGPRRDRRGNCSIPAPWTCTKNGRSAVQSSPRIENRAPELEKILSVSEPIQHLAEGFGGAQGPAEGPLWWKEGG